MAQARRDKNYVPTLIGASSADDVTPIRAWIDPTTNRLLVDAETTGLINVLFPSSSTGEVGAVSVGTSATLIKAAKSDRVSLKITNGGTETVYIGFDSGVTTSNGFPILTQDVLDFSGNDLYTGVVYGIVGTGSSDVRYLELPD